jgi:Fic family protein
LKKTTFFDRFKDALNERQKVIRRMLEEEAQSFEGSMNARKYVSIAKTSKATVARDLQQLVELGVLIAEGGGRSTHYHPNI